MADIPVSSVGLDCHGLWDQDQGELHAIYALRRVESLSTGVGLEESGTVYVIAL
jgi:hypothetical protein